MLNDKQRIELILLGALVRGAVISAECDVDLSYALAQVMQEPVSDLVEPKRSALIRRSKRIYEKAVPSEMSVGEAVYSAVLFIDKLIQAKYIILEDNSYMSIILNELRPLLKLYKTNTAKTTAFKYLEVFKKEGLFRGFELSFVTVLLD